MVLHAPYPNRGPATGRTQGFEAHAVSVEVMASKLLFVRCA